MRTIDRLLSRQLVICLARTLQVGDADVDHRQLVQSAALQPSLCVEEGQTLISSVRLGADVNASV